MAILPMVRRKPHGSRRLLLVGLHANMRARILRLGIDGIFITSSAFAAKCADIRSSCSPIGIMHPITDRHCRFPTNFGGCPQIEQIQTPFSLMIADWDSQTGTPLALRMLP